MKALIAVHGPADPIIDATHSLDAWTLDEMNDRPAANARRAMIIRDLFTKTGVAGIVRLGRDVRQTYRALEAFAAADFDDLILAEVFKLALSQDIEGSFTRGLAGLIRQRIGTVDAERQLADLLETRAADASQIAWLLITWPDERATWATARRLGAAVEDAYWATRGGYHAIGSDAAFLRALVMLLRHGRAMAALESVSQRLGAVPTRALLGVLESVVAEVNANRRAIDGTMLAYYVELVLIELDRRPDAEAATIGAREFALLPLLQRGERSLRLHALMATEPVFFSVLVDNVYRGDGEPEGEIDAGRRTLARLSYTLLTECTSIPGSEPDGINETALAAWIDAVRAAGAASGRAEVTDLSIGRLLAHAPDDADGGWPHRAVREQIERLACNALDRAIRIERFNMRGVHSKALYEGGRSEWELAEIYRGYAERALGWPRTSEMLKAIANDWDRNAEAEDTRAAQDRLRS